MALDQGIQETFGPSVTRPDAAQVRRRKLKPVKWWGTLGVLWLAATCFSVTRWLLGGHAHATPNGPSSNPTYMVVTARAEEIFFTAIVLVGYYFIVWKPWRRERRLTTDGLVLIAFGTLWIQDPILNYTQVIVSYNSAFLNLGCPQCFMPGWLSNSTNFVETPFFSGAFYFGILWYTIKVALMVMRWGQSKWPKLGSVGAILLVLVPFFFFDLVTEMFWNRLGSYSWLGASGGPRWMTLFPDHYYALPIWEVAFAACWYTSLAACWYFKNDKGQMMAERGIDEVRGTRQKRTGLRLLALIGMFNTVGFVSYNLPILAGPAIHWNKHSDDVQKRSYFMQNICGPLTDTACPDSRLPIRNGDSARVSPQRTLVAPRGLPEYRAPEGVGARAQAD